MRRLQIAALVLLTAACAEPPPPWPTVRNVVFITVDTLRADHTSAYGYPVQTTPFLEELATRGVIFDRAYAHSSTTGPSHSSMFTGLYPIQHRVQNNGQELDERFVTLASHLADAGWRTGAFVSAPALFNGSKIRRGFADYDSPPEPDALRPGQHYRPANETIDGAAEWLRRSLGQPAPFFLWVHLYDPHNPLRPPRQHVRALRPERDRTNEWLLGIMRSQHIPAKTHLSRQVARYDAEVRFADEELRRLFRAASDNGASEDTLWVITSDHGQGLKTHGRYGHHEQIYNTQLHVPLIFVFPNRWQAGRRVEQLAGHVDLAPTLLEVLGVAPPEQAAPIQGVSLMPLFGDEHVWNREAVFSERRVPLPTTDPETPYEPGTRHSLQTLTRKYLLFSDGPDEYYRLDVDPYEQANLIDYADADARRLRDMITTLVGSLAGDFTPGEVSEKELRQLRAMGYVQ